MIGFQRRISAFDGGPEWLESLPALLARCADHWSLALHPPFDLSYNYVCPATRAGGEPVVLKIGLPNDELNSEQTALAVYAGDGCVRLIDRLPEISAFLLERLQPGTPLTRVDDDERATRIAADVMAALWKPPPGDHAFRTTADWAAGLEKLRSEFGGGTGPFAPDLVDAAEDLFADLHASQGPAVLLHGDLHHFNILRAGRSPWLAIDPKGILGEREYEIGALLRNPDNDRLNDDALRRRTLRRIDQLAEYFDFDRGRLIGWGLAQAVLSAWWGFEDGEARWTADTLRLAEVLYPGVKK
ncbi:MAG TPA: aminoglycoside phosphotransferase family protein [Anaerolineales bacterium]|nr:aminoglycoside phosphotransferase family protein [Anaerolineales bacterium]